MIRSRGGAAMSRPRERGRAVVLGGGMAGLLATAALRESFDEILLVDRDYLGVSGARVGVPQARHLHVLLQRGRQAVEELLPGTDAALHLCGAPEIDWAADTAWYGRFGWFPRYDSGVRTRSASRSLLESVVRGKVLELGNVEAVEKRVVRGLEISPGGDRIRAVRTDRGIIDGDFFVDATGRGSQLGEAAGGRTVDAQIGYSSCFLKIPPDLLGGFKQIYVQMRPPDRPRGGVLIPVEGERHLLTLVGSGAHRPGTSREEFREFARSLERSEIAEILDASEIASEISCYRRTQGIWRASPKRSMPENYVALGDSACAFNPVYGQGMTVAALQALLLRASLRRGRALGSAELSPLLRLPWFMATSEDLRLAEVRVEGIARTERWMMRGFSRVSDAILRKATRESETHRQFLRVLHLVSGPGDLFRSLLATGPRESRG